MIITPPPSNLELGNWVQLILHPPRYIVIIFMWVTIMQRLFRNIVVIMYDLERDGTVSGKEKKLRFHISSKTNISQLLTKQNLTFETKNVNTKG